MIKNITELSTGDLVTVENEDGTEITLVIDGFDDINDETIMVYAYLENDGEDYTFTVDTTDDQVEFRVIGSINNVIESP